MSRRRQSVLPIIASLVIALLLSIVPLPTALEWFRPYWVALVLIYWVVETPGQVGMGWAFGAGLCLDLLLGSLLGQHALSLVIVAYISSRMRLRMRFFPLWQQALVVLALLLNDRVIYSWIHALSGRGWPDWEVLWAPVVAMLLWPWLFLLLDRARQRLRAR
jgi:rod shape-determining protein MreD